MIESPFLLPLKPDDDAHVGEGEEEEKPRNCIRWISSGGEEGEPAYGSVHRRLDHPEGRGEGTEDL